MNTPEQQRHALDRLLEICKNDVLPHDYGITPELVRDADAFLRTLLRENGEMRQLLRANHRRHKGCSSQASLTSKESFCDCGKDQADRLLSSIPNRSVPPKA